MSSHRVAAAAFAAICVVAAAAVLTPAGAEEKQRSITDLDGCMQAVTDTQEAHDSNPAIGEKAERTFQQLLTDARQHCQARDFRRAEDEIVTAKGMVASE